MSQVIASLDAASPTLVSAPELSAEQETQIGGESKKIVSIEPQASSPVAAEPSHKRKLEIFRSILVSTFYSTSVVVVLIVAIIMPIYFVRLYLGDQSTLEPPLLLVVALCGSLGALFSSLVRLYQLRDLPVALAAPQVVSLNRKQLLVYTLSSPVIGSIAATCIYLVFAGEVFSNEMFPEFSCKLTACDSFHEFLSAWGPKTASDYSKAILWGFAAGFAERLVPNSLDKLSNSLADKT